MLGGAILRLIFNDNSDLAIDQIIEVFSPENRERAASSSLIVSIQDSEETSLDLGERFSEEVVSIIKLEKEGQIVATYEGYSLDNISHRITSDESTIEITFTSILYSDSNNQP